MLRLLPFALMVLALGFLAAQPEGAGLHGQTARSIGIAVLPTTVPPLNAITFSSSPYRYNLGYPGKYVQADGWQSTWADDDKIYTILNDTPGGWQGADGASNTAIGWLDGYTSALTGYKVNTMTAFGTETQYGSDRGTSKLGGIMSVGGVLYALYYRGQTCINGTIIKSIDHGANWVPMPPGGSVGVYTTYMFPGNTFPLTWVYYSGKDYPSDLVDRSGEFAYAGFNDCGGSTFPHHVWLGRVRITALPNLSATDWTYWQGGDGTQDANWGSLSTAQIILTLPTTPYNSRSVKGIHYLPAYQQYLAFAYTNTGTSTNVWTIYKAPHPWGPYTQVNQTTWNPQALYTPSILAKSLAADGGHTFTVAAAGDYTKQDSQTGYYTLWLVTATVN